MQLDPQKPQPKKLDKDAPKMLEVTIKDGHENLFLSAHAMEKHFSTGSVGYFLSGKAINPVSQEKYQVSINITLIGSKPE